MLREEYEQKFATRMAELEESCLARITKREEEVEARAGRREAAFDARVKEAAELHARLYHARMAIPFVLGFLVLNLMAGVAVYNSLLATVSSAASEAAKAEVETNSHVTTKLKHLISIEEEKLEDIEFVTSELSERARVAEARLGLSQLGSFSGSYRDSPLYSYRVGPELESVAPVRSKSKLLF